jgi:hypothetical protein
MSQEHIVGADHADDGPAVVEWGDPAARSTPRVPRGLSQAWARHRRGPLLAAVAAPALLGSLVSDWRVWTSPGELQPREVAQGVVSFPVVGTAYLVGLFALVGCGGLALFGTGAVRRHARLVGLAVTGVLGATLIATVSGIDQIGGNFEDFYVTPRTIEETGTPPIIAYGRGLFLAFTGVAAAALALYLAVPAGARTVEADPPADHAMPAPADAAEPTAGWAPEAAGGDWPWRPREARSIPAQGGPVDLTVEPAVPFLPPEERG